MWVETTNVKVVLAALESGLSTTVLFDADHAHLASRWRKVGRFDALNVDIRKRRSGRISEWR